MPQGNSKKEAFKVKFVGLDNQKEAPKFAAYSLNRDGSVAKKIGSYDGKSLNINMSKVERLALGPDVSDVSSLDGVKLHQYRSRDVLTAWRRDGLILPATIWERLFIHFHCVSGTVEKCRPWFWEYITPAKVNASISTPLVKPLYADVSPHIFFPYNCSHLCDGVVEVYERECCCTFWIIPDLLDRLRDILNPIPVPIPDPIPDPIPLPIPDPTPIPIPIPDPIPRPGLSLRRRLIEKPELSLARRKIERQNGTFDYASVPSKRLYEDYVNLLDMPDREAQAYVKLRPYLHPLICACSLRKVGEAQIGPDGSFDLCYLHFGQHHHSPFRFCTRSYAYVVKQMINGVMTTVYNGLLANEYFGENEDKWLTDHGMIQRGGGLF